MAWVPRSPSSASKESSRRLLRQPHDVRATLDCGPPRLLRDRDSALTVRRPKPLIPLTTAPLRVSANSMSSFPAATITRAATTRPSASTGAVIAITASETTSLVVKAFMRSLCEHLLFFATRRCLAMNISLNKGRATNCEPTTLSKCRSLRLIDRLNCRPGFTRRSGRTREEIVSEKV